MNLRIVDLFVRADCNQECDSAGRIVANTTRLNRCEYVLLRFHLLNADGTVYTGLAQNLTLEYGLDTSYVPGVADLVKSTNARFLSADWPGTSGWNLAAGRFCCRASLKGTDLGTALSGKSELRAMHAVWATPPDDEAFLLFNLPVMVDNVTVEPGNIIEPDQPASYVTVGALAAALTAALGAKLMFPTGVNAIRFNLDGSFDLLEIT